MPIRPNYAILSTNREEKGAVVRQNHRARGWKIQTQSILYFPTASFACQAKLDRKVSRMTKGKYSDAVKAVKADPDNGIKLQDVIDAANYRKAKYKANWESVNINDVIAKFAPNYEVTYSGTKMKFQTPGSKYRVVADIIGGYLRIEDTSSTGRHRYLDLEGNVPNNFITERGTQQGRSNADYNRVTHFRILKREEM